MVEVAIHIKIVEEEGEEILATTTQVGLRLFVKFEINLGIWLQLLLQI